MPALQHMFGRETDNIWLQQDGAPPHYGRNVRQYWTILFQEVVVVIPLEGVDLRLGNLYSGQCS
ncbi:hypothetical protein J6590_091110 [Homalodisca vitripennis]|nr:hypothetical protein J6590_091110 [Homalodisca vitripennis]